MESLEKSLNNVSIDDNSVHYGEQSGPFSSFMNEGRPLQGLWSDGYSEDEWARIWSHTGLPPKMNPPMGPPLHQQPRGSMMQQDYSSGRPQYIPPCWGNQMNMNWGGDQQRLSDIPQRSLGRQHQQGRFQGGMQGVDVSVPPPMDMQQLAIGMCQMPPPNYAQRNFVNQGPQNSGRQQSQRRVGMKHDPSAHSSFVYGNPRDKEKDNFNNFQMGEPYDDFSSAFPQGNSGGRGGHNVGRHQRGGMKYDAATYNNGWNYGARRNEDENNLNNFQMGEPSDDFTLSVWHDPNGELKKWQRDLGVCRWGDPEKVDRVIRLWLVGEGEEEDLETALARCPVPQKKGEEEPRVPFIAVPKQGITVTGWEEIPEEDPNNPNKIDVPLGHYEATQWSDYLREVNTTENPWQHPNYGTSFENDLIGSWAESGPEMGDLFRHAVENGYLNINLETFNNLPPKVLGDVRSFVQKIPILEKTSNDLRKLVYSTKPKVYDDYLCPEMKMNYVQKAQYEQLSDALLVCKVEMRDLLKEIQGALGGSIMQPAREREILGSILELFDLDMLLI